MRKKKTVNIEKIAKLAGVSTATVSRVLNNKDNVSKETKQKVNKILQSEHYTFHLHPVQNAQKKKASNTIVVFMPDFSNPFNDSIIEGIRKSANHHNYQICLILAKVADTDIHYYEDILKDISVAGIISLAALSSVEIAQEIKKRWPLVMCSEYLENADISFVGIDNVLASKQATNFLLQSGREHIAFANASSDHKYAREREKGYLLALEENNVEVNRDYMASLSTINFKIALSELKFLLNKHPNINAIFATSDLFAAAAISAAKEVGKRVPEDISVVGFDNISLASMVSPSITTVSQPSDDIGYQSCEILIDQIKKTHTEPKEVILSTEFIIRESTSWLDPQIRIMQSSFRD